MDCVLNYIRVLLFLRCESTIVATWETVLIFRRYMLKYLEVKFYDIYNFL